MQKPVIDGNVSPEEWKGATYLEKFADPYTGKLTQDQTEGWLAFDEEAIYVALIAHDSLPEGIVGREIRAGADFDGEDELAFRINTFGTRNWDGMSRFAVNVLNTQTEEISGGRTAKREWRGEWTSATKRIPGGWSAEMRIPWRILNYPSGKSMAMDVNVIRYQARTKIRSMWINQTVAERPELMARWEGVEPPSARFRPKWEYLAYAAPEYENGRVGFRSGLDARYSLTRTMTGLVSINPDFRNIENEIAGIDFTRTERYLDDARPFFSEGSDFFDLSGDFTFGRMFYSRRIEAFDVGAKAFGRLDPSLAVGALSTLDNGRSSATVARMAKSFGPFADVSAYAERLAVSGKENVASGFNANKRWGNFGADASVATERTTGGGRPDSAGAVAVTYEAPKWFVLLRKEWVEPNFDPALAYIPWTDRQGFYLYAEHNNELRTGPVRSYHFDVFAPQFTTYSRAVQERGANFSASMSLRNDMSFNVSKSNVTFPDGTDDLAGGGVTFNSSNRFKRFGMYYEGGTRNRERTRFVSLSGSVRAFGGLDLGLDLNELNYRGVDRQAVLTIGYEMSATRSVTGRVVRHNHSTNAYFAFRNGGGKGTEYYFILGDPNAETTQRRISVKVVWAF